MGTLFFIIGAILKTHPPPIIADGAPVPDPPQASKAMAAMLYIYVCFYSMGWGQFPFSLSEFEIKHADMVYVKVPYLGSTCPISSLHVPGITVLHLPALCNGFSVR